MESTAAVDQSRGLMVHCMLEAAEVLAYTHRQLVLPVAERFLARFLAAAEQRIPVRNLAAVVHKLAEVARMLGHRPAVAVAVAALAASGRIHCNR